VEGLSVSEPSEPMDKFLRRFTELYVDRRLGLGLAS
jgi:hypothetical protein